MGIWRGQTPQGGQKQRTFRTAVKRPINKHRQVERDTKAQLQQQVAELKVQVHGTDLQIADLKAQVHGKDLQIVALQGDALKLGAVVASWPRRTSRSSTIFARSWRFKRTTSTSDVWSRMC